MKFPGGNPGTVFKAHFSYYIRGQRAGQYTMASIDIAEGLRVWSGSKEVNFPGIFYSLHRKVHTLLQPNDSLLTRRAGYRERKQ